MKSQETSEAIPRGIGSLVGLFIFTNRGAVAVKRLTGLRRNERRVCGETTNGGAIRMVLIDADELPQPLRGNINKLTRYPASPGFRWRSTPGYIPQPLRG